MATLQVGSGEWDEALLHARTALSVSSDDELVWLEVAMPFRHGAILADRGDWDLAASHLAQADAKADQRPNASRRLRPPGLPPPPSVEPGAVLTR